ncbi:hypothetical protein AWZ03_004167 [Drosophila navojoa]|uniref:Uncharacterized protein n=1 Tax=Drosophila navojoa TaxID=7232 RepID=A0A484BLD1_DRONA|nr:hypothetical protein AWZ03_004167 [Drosophila navojoa]
MEKENSEIQSLDDGMNSSDEKMQPSTATAALPIAGTDSKATKRPHSDLVAESKEKESDKNIDVVKKVLLSSMRKYKQRVKLSVNNGFERGLTPERVVMSLMQDNVRIFAVRFKHRRLPEYVTEEDVRKHAPYLLNHM